MSGYNPQDHADPENGPAEPRYASYPQSYPGSPQYHNHFHNNFTSSQHANAIQGAYFAPYSNQISGNQASYSGQYTGTSTSAPIHDPYSSGNSNNVGAPQAHSDGGLGSWNQQNQAQNPSYPPQPSYGTGSESNPAVSENYAQNPESAPALEQEWAELPTVHIQIAPSWEGVIATKDTGTAGNWICEEIVTRFRLDEIIGEPEEHITFNGESMRSCKTVQATWCVSGAQKSQKCEFRVVANAPFDILFGRNFLKRHGKILSSKEARPADPLLVLVQRSKTSSEQKAIDDNRKKAQDESSYIEQSRPQGEVRQPRVSSGSHKHNSKKKDRKKT